MTSDSPRRSRSVAVAALVVGGVAFQAFSLWIVSWFLKFGAELEPVARVIAWLGLLSGVFYRLFSLRDRNRRRATTSLHAPPGTRLKYIAEMLYSRHTCSRVFFPLLAELQEECFNALKREAPAWDIRLRLFVIQTKYLVLFFSHASAQICAVLSPIAAIVEPVSKVGLPPADDDPTTR